MAEVGLVERMQLLGAPQDTVILALVGGLLVELVATALLVFPLVQRVARAVGICTPQILQTGLQLRQQRRGLVVTAITIVVMVQGVLVAQAHLRQAWPELLVAWK